jgi:hypothetical protein
MLIIKKITLGMLASFFCVIVAHHSATAQSSHELLDNGVQGFFVDWLPFMQPHESVLASSLFKKPPKLSYATLFNTNQFYNVGLGLHYQLKKNWFLSSELIYHYLDQPSMQPSTIATNVQMPYFSKMKMNQNMSLLASISYLFPTL